VDCFLFVGEAMVAFQTYLSRDRDLEVPSLDRDLEVPSRLLENTIHLQGKKHVLRVLKKMESSTLHHP